MIKINIQLLVSRLIIVCMIFFCSGGLLNMQASASGLKHIGTRYNVHEPGSLAEVAALAGGLIDSLPVKQKWNQTAWGISPGKSGLGIADIDNDGFKELICAADVSYSGAPLYVWYSFQYDAGMNAYIKDYTSEPYFSPITCLRLCDVLGNNNPEIITGTQNGIVRIMDADSKLTLKVLSLPDFRGKKQAINDVQMGDIDNNGSNNLVVSTDSSFYIISLPNFVLTRQFSPGANSFRIANVDTIPDLELVSSRGVEMRLTDSTAQVVWEFYSSASTDVYNSIEVGNVDQDSENEIIFFGTDWTAIRILDAPGHQVKKEINGYFDKMALFDYDQDGLFEILYHIPNQKIICYSPLLDATLWQYQDNRLYISALALADTENDSNLEMIFSPVQSSQGPDYFRIVNLTDNTTKWQSLDILPPFYAIGSYDYDNDALADLLTLSYCSYSCAHNAIMSLFDIYENHRMQWQNGYTYFASGGGQSSDFTIADIDADPQPEIILPMNVSSNYYLKILDGLTQEVQNSFLLSGIPHTDQFMVVQCEDVCNSSSKEIIILHSQGYIYLNINANNQAITTYTSPYFYENPGMLRVGNINSSDEKELVMISGNKLVVHGACSHTELLKTGAYYSSLELFDWNQDGKPEIIAGRLDGGIEIWDGNNFSILKQIKFATQAIDGIRLANLGNTPQPEIIYTAGGKIYFYSDNDVSSCTNRLSTMVGKHDGMIVGDLNNDGRIEINIGSTHQVAEIDPDLYRCIWLRTSIASLPATCRIPADGAASVIVSGGTGPYLYNWVNGATSQSINNLTPGLYSVHISDANGCGIIDTVTVGQSYLTSVSASNTESCSPGHDAFAEVTVTHGLPPYSYAWNNGATANRIDNQERGHYNVVVTDQNGCKNTHSFVITKDTMVAYFTIKDATCHGAKDGEIRIPSIEANPPVLYSWSNGAQSQNLLAIGSGTYSVIIKDASNCQISRSFQIKEQDEILASCHTTPDMVATTNYEGTVTYHASGGVPPYHVTCTAGTRINDSTFANLRFGTHNLIVTDNIGCVRIFAFKITPTYGTNKTLAESGYSIYPNPTGIDKIFLKGSVESIPFQSVQVMDMSQKVLFRQNYGPNTVNEAELSLEGLKPGLYLLQVGMPTGNCFAIIEKL